MNILSRKRYDEMCDRGWHHCFLKIKADGKLETYEELAQRYRDKGYEVKQYYMTTTVRGYYDVVTLFK